jgi:hypothetical protein
MLPSSSVEEDDREELAGGSIPFDFSRGSLPAASIVAEKGLAWNGRRIDEKSTAAGPVAAQKVSGHPPSGSRLELFLKGLLLLRCYDSNRLFVTII